MSRLKKSIYINIIIFILALLATIMMFTGFKFMHGQEVVLEVTKLEMLKFFTVQSNILMGIVALIFAIEEIKVLNNKQKEINKTYYILKLAGTTSVSLTLFIVFAYLGPITKYGIESLLMNSNLFYHLIIPLLSIMTFIIYENNNKISFKDTIYGIIPTLIYSLYYIYNVLIHSVNGKVSPTYDWYWFVQNGIWTAFIVAPLIILSCYAISIILYKLNKV